MFGDNGFNQNERCFEILCGYKQNLIDMIQYRLCLHFYKVAKIIKDNSQGNNLTSGGVHNGKKSVSCVQRRKDRNFEREMLSARLQKTGEEVWEIKWSIQKSDYLGFY